jgi:VanZ family protein
LPALAWTAIVLGASNDQFSASRTEEFFTPLLHFFLPAASPSTIDLLHFLIRKTAHLLEYGILGFLYLRAQRGGCHPERGGAGGREQRISKYEPGNAWATFARRSFTSLSMTAPLISLGICLLVASVDEIHQSFVPSRTGTWHDVVLDMAGAVMFQVIAVGVMRRGPGR